MQFPSWKTNQSRPAMDWRRRRNRRTWYKYLMRWTYNQDNMDQLYHIGNKIFDYYLDLGTFKQDPEKRWRFFSKWDQIQINKTSYAQILDPIITWRYQNLWANTVGITAIAGFTICFFIITFIRLMDKKRQERLEELLKLHFEQEYWARRIKVETNSIEI